MAAKLRMSSATKPRKSELPFGWAPWPRISVIGPWLVGSLPGAAALNAAPGFGAERRAGSVSVPRHDVASVAKTSTNMPVFSAQGAMAPAFGPGMLR